MAKAKGFAPGDVVWGPDPFHDDDPEFVHGGARPWLVVSNEAFPGHGDQYICCALTSGAGVGEAFIPVRERDWTQGKPGKKGHVDCETLITMKHAWVVRLSGTLHRDVLQAARKKIKGYLS